MAKPALPRKPAGEPRQATRAAKTPASPLAPVTIGGDNEVLAGGQGASRNKRMRLRAAWMYFVEEMTQNEIAQRLGIGRVTVVRLLSDLRERNEIKFSIDAGVPECIALERELETIFGLEEAVVAPLSDPQADAAVSVAAATGQYVSALLQPGMRIGVGWGRTLHESLRFMSETPVADLGVISLLGGITKVRRFNPSEFAWRFSSLVQAECYLMTAPAVVDSPETRQTLIDKCGLAEVFENARTLDAVLLSVGDVTPEGTAYRYGVLPEDMRQRFVKMGAVGDLLFHYFDQNGELIADPIQGRVMSVPVDTLKAVPRRIIASGGTQKAAALLGAIRLVAPTTLITDEHAARALIALASQGD
ncbi:MAG: sugar-binding domain-containing protein [Polaromonas sp.]|nr:sugar-binding domain-containing protein [Polaromonas sp.]